MGSFNEHPLKIMSDGMLVQNFGLSMCSDKHRRRAPFSEFISSGELMAV
jgi:hypothetical protein